jgi:hypothetical protein
MKIMRFFVVSLVLIFFTPRVLHAQQDLLLITEFLAENERGLADEDGERQDWIEIYNAGTNTVNLNGWYLTDAAGNKTKWRFPATNILANRYLVVFASNKDRRTAGAPLHTNFRLSNSGEYLGLIKPDGVTVAWEYAPAFPAQVADISYGLSLVQTTVPLLSATNASKYLVPTDDSISTNWFDPAFNDLAWFIGTAAIGFETEASPPLLVADSATEFSGNQGQDNWFYGYYNKTLDGGGGAVYQASNFVAFPKNDGPWAVDNFWTGVQWDWYAGNPPWIEIGRSNVHPQASSGLELWAIRRWVSEVSSTIRVDWFLAKANTAGGDGVTGRIFQNNTQRDSAFITGVNGAGTNRSIIITNVQVGDTIDIALDAGAADGSDGSYMTVRIYALPTYTNQITTTIQGPMLGNNATAYIRIPFTATNVSTIEFLTLRMKYDDGFVAYLNGERIVSRNAPEEPQWNSAATDARINTDALLFEDIDISPGVALLRNGLNVLAIQGLNASASDIDFLISAELRGATLSLSTNSAHYFTVPTPGAPNGFGNTNLGPLVFNVSHTPNEPLDNEDLTVTAFTRATFNPIGAVTLTYRIMYTNEITIPMYDDGLHGDGPPGDGQYGASIPANVSNIGDMVRYYVRAYDSLSNVTRFPTFTPPNTNNSPQYFGTIVHNPFLTNPLPVLHFFIPGNVLSNSVNNDNVGRYSASIYYLGEFYDNIHMNRHGQSSQGFPRKSYDLDFNPGYNFRYDPNEERVDDINLLSTYPDKAKMRNMLSYQIYKDAGAAYHFVYPIRMQLNGLYYADYHFVENGDENYLSRLGWDPRGALYKMYNTFDSPALGVDANAEKKTRKWEGNEDLVALYNGCVTGTNYLFDNINIPETINFLASRIITGDVDCCHKNYYFYRDSEGTGEWAGTPWDVDLSFGRNWNSAQTYWDETMHPENGFNVGGNNRLFGALIGTSPSSGGVPSIKEMYYRRIRTLMDELLQPTNTPPDQLNFERQIDYWTALMAPDAELEKNAWPSWGQGAAISTCCTQSLALAATIMKTNYLPARRNTMYLRAPATIPLAQPTNAVILIGAIEYNPANANQAQEYIQLRNTNNFAVDMSFWSITGAISYTFRGGTVLPANFQMFVSPDVVQFRARPTGPRAGQGNFVQGNYKGQLSARGESLYLVDRKGRSVYSTNYPGNPSLPQQYLRITELMYHPAKPPIGSLYSQEDFEYIELRNIGPVAINLTGVHFVDGVEFAFTSSGVTNLGAGQRMLLVKNLAAFTSLYGSGFNIGGVYTGTLDNGGETIRLDDAVNEKILEFRYENQWYPSTDGMGFSLVIVDDTAPYYTWNAKTSWRPSGVDGGNPGTGDLPQPAIATILVNEVYTHSDPAPPYDYIELYNPNTNEVNISGWFISDDFTFPKKYRIPDGRIIPAGGYMVFDENNFNTDPNSPLSFSFSSKGDEAYVFSGDGTNLTGFFHGYEFGAAENGVSFGRYYMSTGAVHFVAQSSRTPGATNALPKVGPVVISEVMYHPPDRAGGADDQDMEFIELYNITSNSVALFENGNSWRIRGGVEYDFPSTASISGGGYVIVVSFHPLDTARAAAFRARYSLGAGVPLFGPYSGKLDNSHDRIELQRPDVPDGNDIPRIVVDELEYSDLPPWPQLADGFGPTLQRLRVGEYGNDAINWTSVVPTPNAPYPGGDPPTITTQPTDRIAVVGLQASFSVVASSTSPVAYQWFFNDNQIPGAVTSTLTLNNVSLADAGTYAVVVFNGGGYIRSSNATLTVLRPVNITSNPTNVVLRGTNDPANFGKTFANAVFSVQATSDYPPINYQWYYNSGVISGATSSTLTLNNVTLANEGFYHVVLTDGVSTVPSAPARLSVLVTPILTEQPVGQTVAVGDSATMRASVMGNPLPLGYRWRRSGAPYTNVVINQTNHSITLNNIRTNDAGTYTVIVTNIATAGTAGVLSSNAYLTVVVPHTNQTAAAGTDVTFRPAVFASLPSSGFPIVAYQWRFNASPIPNATNNALNLTNVQTTNEGTYSITISVSGVTGTPPIAPATFSATLTVISPPTLASPQVLSNGTFTAFIQAGSGNRSYVVEMSSNLVDWVTLSTVNYTNGPTPFMDTGAPNGRQRFYRARLP